MYDQYDFESQNFESEKRRLIFGEDVEPEEYWIDRDNYIVQHATYQAKTLPPTDPPELYYMVDYVWWKVVPHVGHREYQKQSSDLKWSDKKYIVEEVPKQSDKDNAIFLNRRFITEEPAGHMHFYSQVPNYRLHWQWFKQVADPDSTIVTYEKEDAPPDFESQTYEYIASKAGHTHQAGIVKEDDEMERNATFIAYDKMGIEFPTYFYSVTEDQWWKKNVAASHNSGHATFLSVDAPRNDCTIAYRKKKINRTPQASEVNHQAAVEAGMKKVAAAEEAKRAAKESAKADKKADLFLKAMTLQKKSIPEP